MKRILSLIVVLLAATLCTAQTNAMKITGIGVFEGLVTIQWAATSSLDHVVLSCTNLLSGQFAPVGSVITNPVNNESIDRASLPSTCFFKVMETASYSFQDPALDAAIRKAIGSVFPPTNRLYDFQMSAIKYLDASGCGITNMAGIQQLSALECLNLASNQMKIIDCSGMRLTNLVASSCPQLITVHCDRNRLTMMNASNCVNLKTLTCTSNLLTGTSILLAGSHGVGTLNASTNSIVDLASFTNWFNSSFDTGWFNSNPLNSYAKTNQIPTMQKDGLGATVYFDP